MAFWPARAILERLAAFERVAPRFDSTLTAIYNVRRFLRANTRLVLISSDARSTIGFDLNDLMNGATLTRVDDSGFNDANVRDHDDSTHATTTLTLLPAYATRIIAYWDLGSVATRVYYILISSTSVCVATSIDISTDLASWTGVCGATNSTATCVGSVSFRYIRYRISNPCAGDANPSGATRVFTIEAFSTNVKNLSIPSDGIYALRVISAGHSNLLEVVQL